MSAERIFLDNLEATFIKGEPVLVGAAKKEMECGCKVIGQGTLKYPLTIKFCNIHNHVFKQSIRI